MEELTGRHAPEMVPKSVYLFRNSQNVPVLLSLPAIRRHGGAQSGVKAHENGSRGPIKCTVVIYHSLC